MTLPPYKFNRARPSEIARLRRLLTLLAEHVGVDLDYLEAADRADRRLDLADWQECVAVGVDPVSGEAL